MPVVEVLEVSGDAIEVWREPSGSWTDGRPAGQALRQGRGRVRG